MKKRIEYIGILIVCLVFTAPAYAQPANDNCGTATPITVGNGTCNSILYTNVAATSVGDPAVPACWSPASLSHSVWFSFVATTADIEISTNFAGTLADTQLAVYSGTCGSLTQIGCQENINTGGGLLHTDVILHGLTIGNTYYLLVDGNGNTTGTFGICAQESLPVGPTLPTQDCTGAQTLCGLGNISVPNGSGGVGSTIEAPSCFGSPGERSSNWYTFTAATSGILAFTITPTSVIDYDFAVYNTTTSCPGTELVCNWDPATGASGTTGLGCPGVQCEPTFNVVAGQTYTILVDRYTAASTSGFNMSFAGTTATFASPNPTFTATTACLGTATQFTNTTNGNFTYNWNFGDGFTSNLENPTHTFATSGPHSVTLLLTAVPGGCQNAVTQIVNVNPIPTVDAGLGGSVCPGNCLTLGGSTNATGFIGPITFTNTNNYSIPDGSTTGVYSPIVTSGLAPTVIGASSIASVCLNITHPFDADLDIYLQCPDGTRLELSTDNGGFDADYTNTCFTPSAATSITAGTAPFTGNFSPEQSFNVLNGCTANGIWQLFVQDDASIDTGNIISWTITFNNNLPAYTWSPTTAMSNSNTLSPTVCPTATITYTLTANSSGGCTASDTVTVNYTPSQSPVISCGTLTPNSVQFNWLAVTGATSYIISYQINSGPIVNPGNIGNLLTCTINSLSPGDSVTITVTPVGGTGTCFTSASLTCTATSCIAPAVPTVSTTAPTCSANGFTTITNYNAANTYTFSPVGPTAGAGGTISGAAIGTAYTVTATSGGCTSAASASFTNLIQLTTPAVPTVSTTAPTCLANGFTTITNYNAANTYTFSPVGPTAGAGGTISGAAIGTAYTVTATSGGCTSAASASFTNLIQLTTPAVPTVSTTAPTCSANGFTTITNYNAANTYTFSPVGPTAGAGGTISGAVIGTAYNITATSGGCTSAASASFTNLIQLTTPAVPTVSTNAPTCLANGFTTITNYNAANTYTFSPVGPTAGAGGTISGAAIGTAYNITATSGGCTSAASASFTNLIQLTTPAVPTVSTTAPTCSANGFTTITNYNAANTYTFSPTGPTAGAGGLISGAVIGTAYTVTATSGGCTSAASASFTNLIQLTTPAVPTVSTTAPTCSANGFTTITNYNAANTYTFSPAGPTTGAGGVISGAVIGTAYNITATSGGCTSATSASFTNLIQLTTPAVPTVSTTAPTCSANGFTTITNYNAANTYTFSPAGPTAGAGGVISGAVIGTAYTITATSGGCTSAASASFTNLIQLTTPTVPTVSTTTPTCSANGFTTITNYNAANTYSFSPAGPTAGAGGTISGAAIGTAYTITATSGGCTSAASASFTNLPPLFNITTTSVTPLHYCDPNNDGFGTFNLTQLIPGIISGNPYTVTFHETPTDAAIGGTTIPNPANYDNINVNSQTIYIRVQDNATGCYTVLMVQLIVDPTPEATEPHDYHICDTDNDGLGVFNLASVTSEVLGSISPVTHSVSFYNSLTDAQSGSNAIAGLTAYTSASQTIWIRVQNIATGCYDIVTLELIVYPLPLATQPNYPQYSLCDVNLPLAYEEFDLGSRIPSIQLGQNGINVTFHFSQADATANINPLPLLYTNAVPFVQTIWIRLENTNTGCFVLSTMDLRVEPLPSPIPPNTPYTICDTNQDGFGTFNLNTLTSNILQGANYTISYHETYADAQSGSNSLSSPYDNIIPFTQFIYVLAVDNNNGCRNVIPIELQVNPQPITPFTVPDLVQCDQDNNPFDGSTLFNLTQNTIQVLSIQPLPTTSYTVSYHTSQTDAINGIPQIVQISNYIGTNHQIIWVRVENNATGCFSIGSFELIINAPLVLTTPAPLSICDSDAIPNNQFTQFDLTVKNNEITSGQPATVTYYPSYPVTASSVPISNPSAYTNTIPAVQTLGVMVTTADGCKSYTSIDIRVLPIPVPNLAGIRPLTPQCDVNNTGDMMELFDLTVNAATIINGDPTLTLHYYPTQADAIAGTNQILTPTAALVGNNVWIRVENTRVDYQGNNCFVLVEQPLTVNPLPAVMPSRVVQNCDDDNNGQTSFDLTAITSTFYSGSNVTITYYTSAANAQSATSPITSPSVYLNTSNPQIIYTRVIDNATGCVNYSGQFTLTVNPKPTATAPANFDTCDTDGNNNGLFSLDLTTYVSGVIGSQTGVTTTFYNTQIDAVNATDPITDLINYQTYTHTIWIRVENNTTGCYELVPFHTTVEQLAEPNITAPSNTICVEYGTNVLLSGLLLDSGITNPNYTFEWYLGGTLLSGSAPTYTINTVAPGDYTVMATSTSTLACASNPSAVYTVIQSGPAQFDNPPFTVSNAFDDNQIITVNVVGYGLYEYSLDDGPFQSSNIFENASLGEHTITVKDTKGNTSCGDISLNGVQTINYPHYFTPNGDGIHDTWNVVGLENQPGAKLYIFDRYGKLLKQISTNGNGWDGTYNGHLLPADDYWFKIEYTEQLQLKEFKSHFTLKR